MHPVVVLHPVTFWQTVGLHEVFEYEQAWRRVGWFESHASAVQAFPSSQALSVNVQFIGPTHASTVHTLLSLQMETPEVQPILGSQVGGVQESLVWNVSQEIEGKLHEATVPSDWHLSSVQRLLSLQRKGITSQLPVVRLQDWGLHRSELSHATSGKVQVPPTHVSVVHKLLSLQTMGTGVQTPAPAGSQLEGEQGSVVTQTIAVELQEVVVAPEAT